MKNAKLRISAMLLLLAALLLSACGHTEGRAAQYKIYLITKSTSTEFWRSVFAGANAARAEYNVNLVIRGPDTEENYAGQNMYIQEAIRNHADAIVFSAISYTENAAAIDEAAEAGIKIVVIDSDVNSSRVSARIGTDNIQAGRITAAAALDTEEQHLSVGIVNFAQFRPRRIVGVYLRFRHDPVLYDGVPETRMRLEYPADLLPVFLGQPEDVAAVMLERRQLQTALFKGVMRGVDDDLLLFAPCGARREIAVQLRVAHTAAVRDGMPD